MGCCLSTGDHHSEAEHRRSNGVEVAAVLEEETVKEVMLETTFVPKVDERIKPMPEIQFHGNTNPLTKCNEEEIVPKFSQASEICSHSESFSNATAAQEKRDEEEDDGVVNQGPPPRKRRATGGRGRVERGISRRTAAAPSPEKRGQVAPLRPARGRSTVGQPRNIAEGNGRQRVVAEDSGGRSRSPVRRRNVNDEKRPPTEEPPHDVVTTEEAESLENPVVSLECFIFL